METTTLTPAQTTELATILGSMGHTTTTSTTATKSVGKTETKTDEAQVERAKVQAAIKRLTAAWTGAVGKTIEGVLQSAAIIAEAKTELQYMGGFKDDPYFAWLRDVAKTSEGTANKYIMIDAAFGAKGPLQKYKDRLPHDWTKVRQLARFTAEEKLTPKKAEKLFLDALAYMTTPKETDGDKSSFPTSIEINTKVNELLKIVPKEKLFRPEENKKLVTNVPPPETKEEEDGEESHTSQVASRSAATVEILPQPLQLAAPGLPAAPEVPETNIVRFDGLTDDSTDETRSLLAVAFMRALRAGDFKDCEVIVRTKVVIA